MKNNAEIIKGIDMTIAGLEAIKTALADEVANTPVETPKKSVVKSEKAQSEEMNPPAEETEGSATVTGQIDVDKLKSMKYNEFKKLAASLGVKCTGTRDEIMERILALDVIATDEEAEVSEPASEEESPAKSDTNKPSKKLGKKKADEPTTDEFDEQAEEIAKDTPLEDIIEALSDVDIKATKKNAVTLLAKALREGLIELDSEDEGEAEPTEEAGEDSASADDEIGADSYFAEYDPEGYNDPKNMSEERAEAVEAKMDEIITAYSEDELTDKDVQSYVEENATEEEIELLGDEYDETEVLKLYMELVKRTIDNEGEEHEQGDPYEVGDNDMCCGHELKYVKKTGMYVCEHCGSEYEAE